MSLIDLLTDDRLKGIEDEVEDAVVRLDRLDRVRRDPAAKNTELYELWTETAKSMNKMRETINGLIDEVIDVTRSEDDGEENCQLN